MKIVEFTEDWINNLPKTINENGCWIAETKHSSRDYASVQSNGLNYLIHRLVVSIYYNLDYKDHKWEARHNVKCDKKCFFIKHLQPGSHTDNIKDLVKSGNHFNASKICCTKCRSKYTITIVKTGWNRGKKQRYCRVCHLQKCSRRHRERNG